MIFVTVKFKVKPEYLDGRLGHGETHRVGDFVVLGEDWSRIGEPGIAAGS